MAEDAGRPEGSPSAPGGGPTPGPGGAAPSGAREVRPRAPGEGRSPAGGERSSRPGPRLAGARRRRNAPGPDRTAPEASSDDRHEAANERDMPLPHDFGRDGTSGLVNHDRALRAREVSRPRPEDDAEAVAGAEAMLKRLGRRR